MERQFTRQAENALKLAKTTAKTCGHGYIGTEHLLAGLLKEPEGTAGKVLQEFNVEEENIFTTIQRQIDILKEKGFKKPIICPVSSRAAYLAKQFQTNDLTRSEKRELYNYIDKFEQMGLPDYYEKTFKNMKVVDKETEEMQLLKTSGLAYIEKIILSLCKRRK